MADFPSRRTTVSHTVTTYRRHSLTRLRRRQSLFSRRSPFARISSFVLRWRAASICFFVAFLVVASACMLPLFASSPASAEADTNANAESKGADEAAALQSGADSTLARAASFDAPAQQQYPELPTGCESVALTNALMSQGFNLSKTEVADQWLPRSSDDFVYAFMGDPHQEDGHSCMAPGVTLGANAFLNAQRSNLQAVDLTGSTFGAVLDEVAQQHPVIAWCTIGLEEPGECYRTKQAGGRTYRLLTNSHCVVIHGYDLDAGTVLASDSLNGQVTYPLETLAARYYALGAQAVVIR